MQIRTISTSNCSKFWRTPSSLNILFFEVFLDLEIPQVCKFSYKFSGGSRESPKKGTQGVVKKSVLSTFYACIYTQKCVIFINFQIHNGILLDPPMVFIITKNDQNLAKAAFKKKSQEVVICQTDGCLMQLSMGQSIFNRFADFPYINQIS